MLVLTRKTQQQIYIGNDVVITILHVKGRSVRVGIEAPRQVRVARAELKPTAFEPAEQPALPVAVPRDNAPALPVSTPESMNLMPHDRATSNLSIGTGRRSPRDPLPTPTFSRPDRLATGGSKLATLVASRHRR